MVNIKTHAGKSFLSADLLITFGSVPYILGSGGGALAPATYKKGTPQAPPGPPLDFLNYIRLIYPGFFSKNLEEFLDNLRIHLRAKYQTC